MLSQIGFVFMIAIHNVLSMCPVSEEYAWLLEHVNNNTSKLHLTDSKGIIIPNTTVVIHGHVHYICCSPDGRMFGSFSDRTFRQINTRTGQTHVIITTQHVLTHPILTTDGCVVAAPDGQHTVEKYSMTNGQLQAFHGLQHYNVLDISECPRTKNIAITCYGVVVILGASLQNEQYTYTGLPLQEFHSTTAVFDPNGHLLVSHCYSNIIYEVSLVANQDHTGFLVTTEHTHTIPGITTEMKCFDHVLWARCDDNYNIWFITSFNL